MRLQGHVHNGVVVPDGELGLAENTAVLLIPLHEDEDILSPERCSELLAETLRIAALPVADVADGFSGCDHDSVLYGAPCWSSWIPGPGSLFTFPRTRITNERSSGCKTTSNPW